MRSVAAALASTSNLFALAQSLLPKETSGVALCMRVVSAGDVGQTVCPDMLTVAADCVDPHE